MIASPRRYDSAGVDPPSAIATSTESTCSALASGSEYTPTVSIAEAGGGPRDAHGDLATVGDEQPSIDGQRH